MCSSGLQFVLHCYRARFTLPPIVMPNPREVTEHRFMTQEEALDLPLYPFQTRLIQRPDVQHSLARPFSIWQKRQFEQSISKAP